MKTGVRFLAMWLYAAPMFFVAGLVDAGDRKKSLDFNEQLIEGLNKRPLDSLNSLNDGTGDGKHRHLYRRKIRFNSELRSTLRDVPEISTAR
jgi:hypothetical protein